uniref:Papain family cysteine protease n=2 Tax=Acrobeloides nanus TaxID=290746 RepID=A0A914DC63_9BILA
MKPNYHLVINDENPYGSTISLEPLLMRKPNGHTLYQSLFLKTIYLAIFVITLTLVTFIFMSIFEPKGFPFPPENVEKKSEESIFDFSYELEHVKFFDEFKNAFNKKYESLQDEAERFSIFREEYIKIREYHKTQENSITKTQYGVNGLSDMSEEEFAQLLLPKGHFDKMKKTAKFIKTRPREWETVGKSLDDYPPSFDWREKGVITPVKAQKIDGGGYCGSCWAFACAATVESAHAIKYGVQELRNLSTQQLLDCDLNDDGCGGGEPEKAFRYIHEHGLTTWESYPYIAEDWHNNTCKLHGNDTEKTSFEVAYFLHPDELSIIDWLVNFGPVNVAINVPPDMKPYTGGIYKPSDHDCIFKLIGTHALNIVGYGKSEKGEKYWIIKNSWGTDWGIENGYIHFARGINTCGVEDKPIGLLG